MLNMNDILAASRPLRRAGRRRRAGPMVPRAAPGTCGPEPIPEKTLRPELCWISV